MKVLVTLLALALSSAGLVPAADVQLAVHQIEVSHEKLSVLLAEGLSDDELFTKVRGMVKAKSAVVQDTNLIRLKADHRATIESIREIIYLTEYEPETPDPRRQEEMEAIKKLPKEKQRNRWMSLMLAYNFLPILASVDGRPNFESRNVGLTLEVGARDDARGWRWDLEQVDYKRDTEMGRRLGLDGKAQIQRMPNFDTLKLNGDAPVAKGVVLAGVLTPVAADGSLARDRKIMVFVKADILEDK
jgi:hypothetical protein